MDQRNTLTNLCVRLVRRMGAANALRGLCAVSMWMLTGLPVHANDAATYRLEFKNGDSITGVLRSSQHDGSITIESRDFLQPLEFDVQAVHHLSRSGSLVRPGAGGYRFILTGGTSIVGQLLAMSEESLVIESPSLGKVTVPRSQLVRIFRIPPDKSKPKSELNRVQQLALLSDELVTADSRNWIGGLGKWDVRDSGMISKDVGTLVSSRALLPEVCEIHLSIAWADKPNFSIALGCGPEATPEKPQSVATLETWSDKLVLVLESGKSSDFQVLIETLKPSQMLELILYLDQLQGRLVACAPTGQRLAELKCAPRNTARHIQINNFSKNDAYGFRMHDMIIRKWEGTLPDALADNTLDSILLESGKWLVGSPQAFDAANGQLTVRSGESTQVIPLADIRQYIRTNPSTGTRELTVPLDDAAALQARAAAESHCTVRLIDSSQLQGKWLQVKDGQVKFAQFELEQPLIFSLDQIDAVRGTDQQGQPIVPPNAAQFSIAAQLKTDQTMLTGKLMPASGEGILAWQPTMALNAATLAKRASGSICKLSPAASGSNRASNTLPPTAALGQRRAQAAQDRAAQVAQLNAEARLGRLQAPPAMAGAPDRVAWVVINGQAQQVQIINGRMIIPTQQPTSSHRKAEPSLAFRSGDLIGGKIQRIDEKGVWFESPSTKTNFAAQDKLDSVILANEWDELALTAEKRQRLVTVPRSMKSDPPTHLFLSVRGDYLRGRLISLDENELVAEVGFEEVRIPRDTIAKIIWLHQRDWADQPQAKLDADTDTKPDAKPNTEPAKEDNRESQKEPKPAQTQSTDNLATERTLEVHVKQSGGKVLTFTPNAYTDGKLRGSSELLGDCEIAVDEVEEMLFGTDIAILLEDRKSDGWKLTLATIPKAFDESAETEGSAQANPSQLVGQAAPTILLKSLNGQPWNLASLKGRVVVLDFWASWCGPCMQSMPQVDRIVKEVGGGEVELVAVNLQETKEKASAAIERLKLDALVVLDSDGQVARKYEATAIPQTVIIDRDGKIAHLFIGGGNRTLKEFEAALKSMLEK